MTVACGMEHFSPSPEMGRKLRGALSRFGTGVTIVTAPTEKGPIGITANSFSSVSLDPPLVLWSAAKSSRRFPYFAKAERFAIHVLGEEQMPLCNAFSADAFAFDKVNWTEGEGGVPLLQGCLARFECERYAEYDGGDHSIFVAHVLQAAVREGNPLLFFSGQFGNFASTA